MSERKERVENSFMEICYLIHYLYLCNTTRNPVREQRSMITYKWKVSLKLGEDVVFWRVLNFLFCRVVGVGQMRLSSMYGLNPRLVPMGEREVSLEFFLLVSSYSSFSPFLLLPTHPLTHPTYSSPPPPHTHTHTRCHLPMVPPPELNFKLDADTTK